MLRELGTLPSTSRYPLSPVGLPHRKSTAPTTKEAADQVEPGAPPPLSYDLGLSFLGIGNGFGNYTVSAARPDTNLAVGANQIVQTVDATFAVFDKTTGNPLTQAISIATLFAPFGGPCSSLDNGGPIAQYDARANRWVLIQNLTVSPYAVCIAVSESPDATGSYFLYEFAVPGGGLPDYQKFALWSTGWFQSMNNFGANGQVFQGAEVCGYNSAKLLVGDQTAEQICFQLTNQDSSLLPADIDSPSTFPPTGQDEFLIGSVGAIDTSHLSLYSFHVDFANPQNSTFTGSGNTQLIPVASFTPACNGSYLGNCVPQKSVNNLLQSLGDRLMYRFAYYSDDAQFDPIPVTQLAIFQQGTFAPDANGRWMGSIAGDHANNILLGYSLSSPTVFPSIAVAGRTATDPIGTLESELPVLAGTGSQSSSPWGSYSAMRVDPDDNCTFWYTTEYYQITAPEDWSTQIASIAFPNCPTPQVPRQHWYVNFDVTAGSGQGGVQWMELVNALATQTAISSSANPSVYQEAVTFTATVTASGGGSPTGTVTFTADQNVICNAVPLVPTANGSEAPCQIATLTAGSHSLVASYSGDSNFAPSQSPPFNQTVDQAPTFSFVTSAPNPSTYLQAVTISATITGSNGGSPTGTVGFTDNGTDISGCTAIALVPIQDGSVANCVTSTLAVGRHSPIRTSYAGDNNYMGNNGILDGTQVVNIAPTTTVVTANPPSPSNYGQQIIFTATITGLNGGNPTGTADFTYDDIPISGCQGVVLVVQMSGSAATCQTSSLPVGSHSIAATYNGDGNFDLSAGSIPYVIASVATTTALTVTPDSASAGQVVTLAGAVTFAGAPVTGGTVTFLSGTKSLGTVQVVKATGTATLKLRFPPASYSLTAQYNGSITFQPSTSPSQSLTVSGTEPTISILSAQPNGNNYDFTLSVFGFGYPPLAGTGATNNLTQGGTLLGNIPLAGPGMLGFQNANIVATGNLPTAIATGDFNGDGILDFAVVNQSTNNVNVFLGNGDGTFQPQPTLAVGTNPQGIAAGDFNGDGNLDLAVACERTGVSVLLGNGNGTFQPQQTYPAGSGPNAVAVGDFNSDGSPDLAVSDFLGASVVVLQNNGDGTFTMLDPFLAGQQPVAIAVGDFNGDGNLDVALADIQNQAVVLLGDGNGAFQPAQTYPAGNAPHAIAVSDLKGDGVLDLVLTNQGDNTVSVLLGNNNGTFQPQQTYPAGGAPIGIAIGDFTGDGIPDLAVASPTDSTVRILPGNGDGTFQSQLTFPAGAQARGIAVADFNGDEFPDVVTANFTSNNAGVLLGGTITTGQLQNIPVFGSGTQNIQSTFSPSGNFYASSMSNIVPVTGIPQTPTTTVLRSSQNPSNVQQPVTFTATVTANGGNPASGIVTFQSNGVNIPDCTNPATLVNGVANCTTQSLAAGTDNILASFTDPQGMYANSSARLVQTVETAADFTLLPITPGTVTVTQGYNNNNDQFFAQSITVAAQPLAGYNNTVTLSCSVSPALTNGNCVINPPASGSLANGNLSTTLTINAGSTTPIGVYTVTVTGQDHTGLAHFVTLALTVIKYTASISEPSGGGGSTPVMFPGASGTPITGFSCPLVAGTGITGNEPLSRIGGVCTFNHPSVMLPDPVTVTISGCTVARLNTRMPIFASFFFGMPALVWLGSLRMERRARRKILRLMATLLVIGMVMMGMGCGGGYGQLTPTGNYSVLVQGTGPDGTLYFAVVPVTVTPLNN